MVLRIVTYRGREVRVTKEAKQTKDDPPRITNHELFRHVCEKNRNGMIFSEGALEQYAPVDLQVGEGRSERAVRFELGLPYDKASVPAERENCDLPELDIEIKDLFAPPDKPGGHPKSNGNIKFSGGLRFFWNRTFLNIGRMYRDEDLPEKVWTALFKNEFRKGTFLSLPGKLQEMITDRMRPSLTYEYEAIIIAAPDCFLRVDKDEYDKAFAFVGTTRGDVIYELKWDYLEEKARLYERLKYVVRRRDGVVTPVTESAA